MKTTVLEVAIHPEGENPLFGERSTRIRLDDEGAGSFLVIKQISDTHGDNEIRLDFEEISELMEAIDMVKKGRVL